MGQWISRKVESFLGKDDISDVWDSLGQSHIDSSKDSTKMEVGFSNDHPISGTNSRLAG